MPHDLPKSAADAPGATLASPLLFASLATALAGFLDAVGYQQLNHLYVSFMSGNSTHLGMAFAAGEWADAAHAGYIIGAFVAGAFLGTLISDGASRSLRVLLLGEIVLCVAAIALAAAGFPTHALTLIAATMGMQNVMHRDISGTDAGKSFITGSLFGLGQSLARVLTKRAKLAPACVNAVSWLSFIGGVGCGALSFTYWGVIPSLTLASLVLVFMFILVSVI
ncbi:MAG: YoaK family protein [Ensifer adhaerens]